MPLSFPCRILSLSQFLGCRGRTWSSSIISKSGQDTRERLSKSCGVRIDEGSLLDFRKPHEWYSVGRSINRRIIYHAGPTNSGKTYNALQRFKDCERGIYCAPLRLLAMEVCDAMNKDGLRCNLLTGQERVYFPGAKHTSCTIEMIDIEKRFDVGIVDEVQLLGDKNRGFAWTRALHGLAANELHLCGDPSVVSVVEGIAQDMKEEVEVRRYQRWTPLKMERETIGDYDNVRPGDCIVAFARSQIYEIKQIIEYHTPYKVAVIYGALPPELRRRQALLFNTPGNGYDIMVASDAVGMGLNLNIRRIIFHTLRKFNGKALETIPFSQIKQISGRAGRRNSLYSHGVVSCLADDDRLTTRAALKMPVRKLKTVKAGLFPEAYHIERLSKEFQTEDLGKILDKLENKAKLNDRYFLCEHKELREIAAHLQEIPLSFPDRIAFCFAPVDSENDVVVAALMEYAMLYSRGYPVMCRIRLPDRAPLFLSELKALETAYQVASLWLWLSYRLGRRYFPSRERTQRLIAKINELLEIGLRQIVVRSHQSISETPLPTRTRNAKMLMPCES